VFIERLWRSVKYEEVYLHALPLAMERRSTRELPLRATWFEYAAGNSVFLRACTIRKLGRRRVGAHNLENGRPVVGAVRHE
jgi:hypothetical protein